MKGGVNGVSKDLRKRFTFRMPAILHNRLKDRAERMGVSVNSLILQILDDWVQKNEKFR